MKRFFLFALFFIGLTQALLAEYQIKIQPRTRLFSTYYDIFSENKNVGSVKRKHLQLNKIYSVRDKKGEYARGIAKLFSIGTVVKSQREIEIYDEHDQLIGSIHGCFTFSEKGKFTFFNRQKKPLATAYIEPSGQSVSIVDSRNKHIPFALFRCSFIDGKGDPFWEIRVFDEFALEPSMLYIFAAFISDTWWTSEMKPAEIPSWDSLALLELLGGAGYTPY